MPLKPDRLSYGDTIGVVAPASAPVDAKNIERGLAVLEALGFKPKPASNLRKRWGFLAGSDRDRADDLMRMFADRKVKAILCLRGGYGTARLLSMLDYSLIRSRPKIFIGYSDVTSLHCAFLEKAQMLSFHGPMLNSDFIKRQIPAFTLQSFLRTLMQPNPAGSIQQGYNRRTVEVLHRGVASGPLIGGNLSILCASLGTPYQPSFRGKILFFEDLQEVPYRFDRMLTQLLNAGLLQQLVGIAIGINKNCADPKAKRAKEYRQSLRDVLNERLLSLKIPIVSGLPFGHVPANATFPIGAMATLDAEGGDLIITESAVK
ncbi:MAG TPA: LD-carboxypeptidase [Candidatus Limnocylindrales bacterium]|jgi:muramoyltetrapeptide carboxypeptidase|nr:LD-carboxypeptidase [Candidatus Limnocylindrales bacterium]